MGGSPRGPGRVRRHTRRAGRIRSPSWRAGMVWEALPEAGRDREG